MRVAGARGKRGAQEGRSTTRERLVRRSPRLDAGSNQFVAFLGIQGAGSGACAWGVVSRLVCSREDEFS
eukprot:3962836-Prymnesium_polylepis.1